MPSSLDKLATVTIWVFFVTGCLMILKCLPLPYVRYNDGDWKLLAMGLVSLSLSFAAIELKRRWSKPQ